MPIAIGGLHVLLALLCAIHVVRTGKPSYWLFVLLSFPLLGSVVYFFAVYLPNSRLERNALRAVSAAAKAMDPARDVREARAAFDDAPTARSQMRLAEALLDAGEAEEAARLYEGCLKGPFADDPDMRFGAARAFVDCQRYAEALTHLRAIRDANAEYRAEAIALLFARSYAGHGQPGDARAEFESAVARFGTFEARAEYAIWALAAGDNATAARLRDEIDRITSRWSAVTRELNEPVLRRLAAAHSLARQQQQR